MSLVMIALDSDDRNTGIAKHSEARNRMIHSFGRDAALVKEIAAHDDKIDALANRVTLENVLPGIEKITGALGKLVSRTPEVHIRDMQELHTRSLAYRAKLPVWNELSL
jgi:hypothetical protein